MATFQYVLFLTVVLASLSFNAAQGSACGRALNEYFNQWSEREAKARRLMNMELTHEHVKDVFRPSCDTHGNYATKQCFMNKYCWCSDPNGDLLTGTFQKGKAEELDCTKCIVGNNSYKSGDYFKIPETCQSCQCQDREMICQKYFCSDRTKLNSQERTELKKTILTVIYYQYEYRLVPVTLVREEDIAKVPLDVALAYREQRLNWKFSKMDINKDDQLNKEYEFYHFMLEIKHFVKSRELYDTIFKLIDRDGDKHVSKPEWLAFFDNIITPPDGSGSATIDDEESTEGSGDSDNTEQVSTRSVRSSRSLPEVMKEFVKKLHKQQRISHSEDKYF